MTLGWYLSKQIRMGKSIIIPKLGLLTFSAPEFKLDVEVIYSYN